MGYQEALERVSRTTRELWRPPPDIDISDWADEHYRLSPENSSTPGRWKTHAYQREPMNLCKDPSVRRITVKKSSRVGFTKACINIPVAYLMACDPRSILVLLPTEKSAEKHSKVELAPMLRDVAPIRGMVKEGSRTSGDTMLEKHYPGGIIHLGGANSSRVFRQLTISAAFCDETSDYPPSSGGEGSALKLVPRRMGDAWNQLLVEGSSPKWLGACSITDSYEESDQRRFLVPCPHCDHGQFLEFGGKECDFGIKWESGKPETAAYLCEHCHCLIEHREKRRMVDQGVYEATNPDGGWPGFHIWAGYSYLPNAAWSVIAREFLECGHDPLKLQVFENTIKGEAFEQQGKSPSEDRFAERAEAYALRETGRTLPDGEPERENMIPDGVAVITSGTDVQHNRLETAVYGFGRGEETWLLEYHILYGDPTARPIWSDLNDLLRRPRYLEQGGADFIRSSCIDSNYASLSVASFVLPNLIYATPDHRNAYTWAIRGSQGPGLIWPNKPGKFNGSTCPVYTIKVDPAKDALYGRASQVLEEGQAPGGPGYFHVPDTIESEWFRQFSAEHRTTGRNSKGFEVHAYEVKKGRKRNEALDTAVYAYAALWGLYSIGLDLDRECDRRLRTPPWRPPDDADEQSPVAQRAPDPLDNPRTAAPQPAPRRDRWVSSRRDWMNR